MNRPVVIAASLLAGCLGSAEPAASNDASSGSLDAAPTDALVAFDGAVDARVADAPTTQPDGALSDAPVGDAAAPTRVVHIAAGQNHACALLDNGAVRCWGAGTWGRLGYGNEDTVGNMGTNTPDLVGDVDVGGQVMQIVAGQFHTCALLTNRKVRCWGRNTVGQLGHGMGSSVHIGDDETPATAGDVPIGADVKQLSSWRDSTCAVTVDDNLRCWGANSFGMLGHPTSTVSQIGASTPVSQWGDVDLGAGVKVAQVAVGNEFTCVRLTTNAVRCWGRGRHGRLGYADDYGVNMTTMEPNVQEDPSAVGDVSIGGTATDISAGFSSVCVVLTGGTVRCWGHGAFGKLGNLSNANVGETNYPSDGPTVMLGGTASEVVVGGGHACVRLTNNELRCFGYSNDGALGYGNTIGYGDTVHPNVAVPVGGDVARVVAGYDFNCALLTAGGVRCWGLSPNGELGYGNTAQVGKTNTPASVGDVPIF